MDSRTVSPPERHPTAATWILPPPSRAPLPEGCQRTNFRALAARPGRFEHHLTVVATVGDAQLELATASEPLSFAHANLSDEYVVALRTGDELIDGVPFRVFLSDPQTLEDQGRLRHRVHDLVLHPYGHLHWPGRLRPPFTPPPLPPGGRRAVLSLVVCGNRPTPAAADRLLEVTPGREADAKSYVDPPPPLMLAGLEGRTPGRVGSIGNARLTLARPPFAPARGGYVVVLAVDGDDAVETDLVYVPPGAVYAGEGVRCALLLDSETADVSPPPRVWDRVPDAPFAAYERASAGTLPWQYEGLTVEAISDEVAAVHLAGFHASVPRYWLARTLFRVALHSAIDDGVRLDIPKPCLGYVETYGGFFYDDRKGFRLGVRAGASIQLPAEALTSVIESLYRAVAPPGYAEDLR